MEFDRDGYGFRVWLSVPSPAVVGAPLTGLRGKWTTHGIVAAAVTVPAG
ncbi:hypothetical protein [Streptomyces composti]|nr:hypothetical protein [Streptomyces composti]